MSLEFFVLIKFCMPHRNQGTYFHRICRYKIEIDSVSVYIIFLMCQNMPLSVKSIFVS